MDKNGKTSNNNTRRSCCLYIVFLVPILIFLVVYIAFIPLVFIVLCLALIFNGVGSKQEGGGKSMVLGYSGLALYALLVLFSIVGRDNGPWEGRVVDIETGEPLEGTVILAVWSGVAYSIFDWDHFFHRATETVTDESGYFRIPRYFAFNFLPIIPEIEHPDFHIFKPGYYYVDGVRPGIFSKNADNKPESRTRNLDRKNTVTYRTSPNLIELPDIANIKVERRRTTPSRPNVPEKDMIAFTKAINEARRLSENALFPQLFVIWKILSSEY